jgi:hypothetical protein
MRAQTYATATGKPASTAVYPVEMGSIDAGSGNLHLEIPLGSFPQRGLGASDIKFTYDSHIWTSATDEVSTAWTPSNTPTFALSGGWNFSIPGITYLNTTSQTQGSSYDEEFIDAKQHRTLVLFLAVSRLSGWIRAVAK